MVRREGVWCGEAPSARRQGYGALVRHRCRPSGCGHGQGQGQGTGFPSSGVAGVAERPDRGLPRRSGRRQGAGADVGIVPAPLPGMDQKNELKHRIEAKQKELEARLAKLKADSSQSARQERQEIENKLDDLKQRMGDSWDDFSEKVAGKLNEWLKAA